MANTCDEATPGRMKYWHECGQEEKNERMRERIHSLESELAEALKMLTFLQEHMHSATGEVRIPIPRQQFTKGMSRSRSDKEVYF